MIEQVILEAAKKLGEELDNPLISIKVEVEATRYKGKLSDMRVRWTCYADGDSHREGNTLESAIAETRKAMTPAVKAAELRRQASEILARAESLEAAK